MLPAMNKSIGVLVCCDDWERARFRGLRCQILIRPVDPAELTALTFEFHRAKTLR